MKSLKDNRKGITLVSLVITIVVLLILASIATYSGIEVIKSSRLTTFTTEMKIMQTQVNELYQRYKDGDNTVLGLGKDLDSVSEQANKVFTEKESGITDQNEYQYFDQNTIKNVLKIEGVEGEFFVNIKNRSVVSYQGFQYEGKTYYTLEQLPDGLYNVEYKENTAMPSFDAIVEEISENKWKISITNIQYEGYIDKWDVNYQLEGQNYKSEDLSFVVTQKGDYIIFISNGNVKSSPKTVKVLTTVEIAKKMNKVFDDNVELVDTYQNQLTIPKGFKISEDSATDVTGGVVIEDATYDGTMGSQFVWIPVGTVYTNLEKTASGTITLERYRFVGDGTPLVYPFEDYKEDTVDNHDGSYGNAVAKDIEAFKSSTNDNHGYYIGRYEAGVDSGILDTSQMADVSKAPTSNWTGWTKADGANAQIVCKEGQQVWNYITQNKASDLSKNMYDNTLPFTSDLINSYAWDTAIVFIQNFGTESNSATYSYQQGVSTDTTGPSATGRGILSSTIKVDKQCNIFDMAGNCWEWTTETGFNSNSSCVSRGGCFGVSSCPSNRSEFIYGGSELIASRLYSFRPLLYL